MAWRGYHPLYKPGLPYYNSSAKGVKPVTNPVSFFGSTKPSNKALSASDFSRKISPDGQKQSTSSSISKQEIQAMALPGDPWTGASSAVPEGNPTTGSTTGDAAGQMMSGLNSAGVSPTGWSKGLNQSGINDAYTNPAVMAQMILSKLGLDPFSRNSAQASMLEPFAQAAPYVDLLSGGIQNNIDPVTGMGSGIDALNRSAGYASGMNAGPNGGVNPAAYQSISQLLSNMASGISDPNSAIYKLLLNGLSPDDQASRLYDILSAVGGAYAPGILGQLLVSNFNDASNRWRYQLDTAAPGADVAPLAQYMLNTMGANITSPPGVVDSQGNYQKAGSTTGG